VNGRWGKRSRAMNDLWFYILLGGLVITVLIWVIRNFIPWMKLLRKGVLVEGRIEAHHKRFKYTGHRTLTYLSLAYSYSCNETNYLHEEIVGSRTYSELKDGDSVKIRCLLKDPTTAELEAPAFIAFMERFGNTQNIPVDSNEDFPKWEGD
jgi:hypothetical protein